MGRGICGVLLKVLRAGDYSCTVRRIWQHSPSMLALRVSSPDFVHEVRPAQGEYLRCWFPSLENPHKEEMRGYTVTNVDEQTGEFTLFFLLHTPYGPGSYWATHAQVGDTFEFSYYGSHPFEVPSETPQGFVFIADAAGIPYINAVVERLEGRFPIQIWLSRWHESDESIPLCSGENITVHWIEPTPEAMLEKTKSWDWQGWFPHLVCEAKVLLPTRRYLLKEASVSKTFMHSHAYWVKGRAMGTTRDIREVEN
ncbi:siderophore-interacting protein [Rothia sp. P6271]|uniref:siderophore-interacting protein n=1 Tax=unclassified Rothia (in: high G+C Gram-positive bacteria) TaxID=2689056 RepID=UPI003ACEA169